MLKLDTIWRKKNSEEEKISELTIVTQQLLLTDMMLTSLDKISYISE